ncbi:hypothetical protein ACIQMJ_34375 [Actinosynnema sp. NPDC091369]
MGKIDDFAAVTAEHLPAVAARIPPTPAAALGHLEPGPTTTVAEALRSLGPLLAERVLGALEPDLDDLPTHAHGLVRAETAAGGAFTPLGTTGQSETSTAVAMLDAMRPGVTRQIADLVDRLTRHPALSAHFGAPPVQVHDAPVRSRHDNLRPPPATPHLALAVITAHAVLRELDAATPAAVVGVALGTTALHLPRLPNRPRSPKRPELASAPSTGSP